MAIELFSTKEANEIKANFPEAYLKINDIEIRIGQNQAWIKINIFANKEARNTDGACSIKKIVEKVPLELLSPNTFNKDGWLTAAYVYLKTRPEYQGYDI